MATSSLVLTRSDILAEIGRFADYGRNPDIWDEDQRSRVDAIIESGERSFYYPLPLPGETVAHVWSFLNCRLMLQLAADQWQYELPEDFGGFTDSQLSFAPDDLASGAVRLVDLATILDNRAMNLADTSDYPTHAAVTNLPAGLSRNPRQALALWPTPSAARLLTGSYACNPAGIADTTPYPLGGQAHSEALLEACLAAAELRLQGGEGPHTARFYRLLAAAVLRDRGLSSPKHFGYNGNDNYRRRGVRHAARGAYYEPTS